MVDLLCLNKHLQQYSLSWQVSTLRVDLLLHKIHIKKVYNFIKIIVNFVESPSNITQPVGSVAEFRCQHQSIDATISWLVNGSSASRFPDVSQINSGSVSTLTILSVQENNGTEIVCRAFIFRSDGSTVFEQTPPAILTVIEG